MARLSAINRLNALKRKPGNRHSFTTDECSRGGAEARYQERLKGVRLNHGRLFGKKPAVSET